MNFLKSPVGADPVELEALYPVSRERVFAAFVEPEQFKKWFGRPDGGLEITIDPKIGGAWKAIFASDPQSVSYLEGAYTEMDPVSRLAFTWREVREETGGERVESPLSEVIVTLEEEGAATRLKLRHAGVSADGRKNVGPGWEASLGRLGAVLSRS